MGIFPGSLTASRALISQRIGSLDTHGRLWAFKQSTPPPTPPPTHSPTQPPKRHPAPYYSLSYPLIHSRFPTPPSSTLRFCLYHLLAKWKGTRSTFKEPAGLNRVISLNVYTALATSEGCGADGAGVSNQRWYLFPTRGGDWRAAFKLMECIPACLSQRRSSYSRSLTHIHTHTQTPPPHMGTHNFVSHKDIWVNYIHSPLSNPHLCLHPYTPNSMNSY